MCFVFQARKANPHIYRSNTASCKYHRQWRLSAKVNYVDLSIALFTSLCIIKQLLGNDIPTPSCAVVSRQHTDETPGWKIIREMLRHIWPRDHPNLKVRVVSALGLLASAKVCELL